MGGLAVLGDQSVAIYGTTKSIDLPLSANAFQTSPPGAGGEIFVAKFHINDTGGASGTVFQDYLHNGVPSQFDYPAALIVFRDLNGNGVWDPATEPAVGSAYSFILLPGTNIPLPLPNYALPNLPVGSNRVCVNVAANLTTTPVCQNVNVQFGAFTPNVNFGVLPGVVGVSTLSPSNATVAAGEKIVYTLTWTHPIRWRLLDTLHLRFVSGDQEALFIRYQEASNTFSLWNPDSNSFGPQFEPGRNNVLETNMAKFYLDEAQVNGTGPLGPSVTFTLVISFKPQVAGRTWNALFFVSDDNGNLQGYEPKGQVTVTK